MPQFTQRPTNTKHNPTSTRDNSTTIAPIDDTLAYLESLSSGEQFSYNKVAADFSIDRSTLARRHQGITKPRDTAAQQRRNLTLHEEAELIKYIEELSARYLLPTRDII